MTEEEIRLDERKRCLEDLRSLITALDQQLGEVDPADSVQAVMVRRLVETQIREILYIIDALRNMWRDKYGDEN